MWIEVNVNPVSRHVGDCAVRAVAKALGIDWETAYSKLAMNGFMMGDMPSSNQVIGSVLRQNGFVREIVPNTCPDCYTVEDFCKDNPSGTYVLFTDGHVVTAIDGNIYDSWNSSKEIPVYVWKKV